MKYLILFENTAFYSGWYDKDKYTAGMTVFDLEDGLFTTDGETWDYIKNDTL